eukprot:GGOE01062241.1.p1 GENE.GGOE01062241.1~~GGOE01062241.1.p1  ORF type:complete len:798 (-),score=309.62 GGOE01062241.1:322-2655(-)
MSQFKVTATFHRCVAVPGPWKELTVEVDAGWTVRGLVTHLTALLRQQFQLAVDIAMLLHHSRDIALAFHEPVTTHIIEDDKLYIVGDVRKVSDTEPPVELASPISSSKIPVTILTGFLGAGKTTLLNHLLKVQRDKRIAVIENEFGEVPIDNELLASKLSAAEQVVVMDNGCMCCTVRGDLLGAFSAVLDKMGERGYRLDAVIVETTGMADPVPIVRTFLQTPAIAGSFQLDGVVTLADAKNLLRQLESYEKSPIRGDKVVDEAFQQITYADRIIISKLDLVGAADAVAVWRRLRELNASARVVGVMRGNIAPQELTELGAHDLHRIAADTAMDVDADDDHHCGEDCNHHHDDHHHDGDCSEHCEHDHAHDHGHSSRHNNQVGSFSLVQEGVEVDPLRFNRWVRLLATLDREANGQLYRCKGVLAQAGSTRKLVFHAVADVTEQQELGEWGPEEVRGCKMVFIGKRLRRQWFEESFAKATQPCRHPYPLPTTSSGSPLARLFTDATPVFYHCLLFCWTKEVSRLGRCSRLMAHAVFADAALPRFQRAAETGLADTTRKGLQLEGGSVWLHPVVSMPVVNKYVKAVKEAKAEFHVKELDFMSGAEVTAAAVTWLELIDIADSKAQYHVMEFAWRKETMQQFFAVPCSSTFSALLKGASYTYINEINDDEEEDVFKFKLVLKPCPSDTDPPIEQHKMVIQLIGGKSSSQVYMMSFHSIHPEYQLHIMVPDNRMPFIEPDVVFHKWHPMMNQLRQVPRLRFLIRVKPDGSGPLDTMCGCC